MPDRLMAFYHAQDAALHLYAAQAYDGSPRAAYDWERGEKSFLKLAEALGYRVERIRPDGINTGKPVVAGGV